MISCQNVLENTLIVSSFQNESQQSSQTLTKSANRQETIKQKICTDTRVASNIIKKVKDKMSNDSIMNSTIFNNNARTFESVILDERFSTNRETKRKEKSLNALLLIVKSRSTKINRIYERSKHTSIQRFRIRVFWFEIRKSIRKLVASEK